MKKYLALATWVISSIIVTLLALTAAPAADCNLNGVLDDVDLTLPVLRAELPVPFDAEYAWGQPLAEDLDGDGLLDLAALAGNEGGYDHAIWMNRGDGSFEDAVRFPTGRPGRWATAADLDGNGALDLVSVTTWLQTISIVLNVGGGRFSEPRRIPIDHYPQFIGHGDFDGDDRIDLVTAHAEGASVHMNGGAVTFAVHRDLVGPQVFVSRIAAADLEGDGDLDAALLSDSVGGGIVLFSNRGDATFDVSPRLVFEGELRHLVVGSSRVDLQACKLEYSIVSPK